MEIKTFHELIELAPSILARSLAGDVKITAHTEYDEETIDAVHAIDNKLFREELQYSRDELRQMFSEKGFFCLLVYLNGKVIAYDFGYDVGDGVFFSDSTATLIEKKGIGTLLTLLELVYLYEKGNTQVRFKTEEMDQDGRPLRAIWERRGYTMVSSDEKGLTMQLDITPKVVDDWVTMFLSR